MKKINNKTKDNFRGYLGSAVKERRLSKGITQEELAEVIESQQKRIPEIERGDTKNIDTWLAAITALGGELIIKWK